MHSEFFLVPVGDINGQIFIDVIDFSTYKETKLMLYARRPNLEVVTKRQVEILGIK